MTGRVQFIHSSNSGWRTFHREAVAGLGSPPESTHRQLGESAVTRALSLRFADRGESQRARVRRMRAWQLNRSLRDHLASAATQRDGVLIVTQHRALALTLSRTPRPPWSSTLGDAVASQLGEFGMHGSAVRRLAAFERRVFASIDDAFFLSDWARDRAASDYSSSACQFHTARPAIADPFGSSDDLNALTTERRGSRLLFVGNDFRRKGGTELLTLMRRPAYRDVELVVASAAARPDDLPPNVRWLGSVDRNRVLHELMPSSDVLMLPSKRDMSPWVVLEALAAGLPVIASRAGGIPELVEHDRTGVLVASVSVDEIDHAVMRILDDAEVRAEMSNNSRTRFEAAHLAPDAWAPFRSILERRAADIAPVASSTEMRRKLSSP